jgi:ATP-dependent helicase HrpB
VISFWKTKLGLIGPDQPAKSTAPVFSSYLPAMQKLPIEEVVPELRARLSEHPLVVLQAPPGAGKSTLLPIRLLDEPWMEGRKIILLEPRRLAARSVAARLAAQLGEETGATVGFRIRFENQTSASTRIEVVTEGILTRKLQHDPTLEDTALVIFDEFHERSIHADLGLVLCRQLQSLLRGDLRILVMSATLNADALAQTLGTDLVKAPVVRSEGRQYPVEYRYQAQDDPKAVPQNMARAVRKALQETQGDILCFLPGASEINRTQSLLEEGNVSAKVMPLYGDLDFKAQQAALLPDPQGRRKVVLATSIAETSLTIEGVHVVIDSGLARIPRFDPRSGLSRLETVSVTRDAADQRSGRAGRLGPGICYRLWALAQHAHLIAHREPEILQADLAPLALDLAQWGISDPAELAWPTVPPNHSFSQARNLLESLGATLQGKITPRGQQMLGLPTHPRIAVMLLEAQATQQTALGTDLAALLEERDPLGRNPGAGADLHLRIDALRAWRSGDRCNADTNVLQRIERAAKAWRRILRCEPDNGHAPHFSPGQLLAAAYPERIAKQEAPRGLRYRLASGRKAVLPTNDALDREPWLCLADLDAGLNEGRIFLAAPLDPQDLSSRFQTRTLVTWENGALHARRESHLLGLTVSSETLRDIPDAEREAVLCAAIRETPSLLPWKDVTRDFQARVLSLRAWRPSEPWPDLSDAALLKGLEEWLAPYLKQVRRADDFARIDLHGLLMGLLPWPLPQSLENLAPTHIEVPTGSRIRLEYQADGSAPVFAVRLQEVFGWMDTPSVNGGQARVLMHLLSPAYRPCQVTQDLRSFWMNTYSDVRKDLRGRYPKHHWPEDPLTAEAVRGVKRK